MFGLLLVVYTTILFVLSRRLKIYFPKFYEKEKKTISVYELQAKLPILKSQTETAWLSEVSAQSLQSALHNLDKSFSRFFKEKKGFPKFKSKHNNSRQHKVSSEQTHLIL